jgi:hypothetical protein
MATAARWIRLEQNCRTVLRAAFAGFARVQPARAVPAVFWARDEEDGFAYALVVPRRLAPGRPRRWRPWALAPSIATYRQFGERAYLDGDDVWLGGRRIAASEAAAVGDCAVVASSFLARLPRARADWSERNVVAAFRSRIEVQHGWQFDHSWPSLEERAAIGGALALEATGAA